MSGLASTQPARGAGDEEQPGTLNCEVLRDLFGTPAMRTVFASRRLVQGWLDAEAALARAEAALGIIPASAAERITSEAVADRYDLAALRDGVADSQHPLVPLVRALADRAGEDGAHVHWGATTQDIIDTGAALQMRDAARLLASDVERACAAALTLARRHATTPMAGRTHGQHAVPITFGLKAASWADELARCRARLELTAADACCAHLAGAAGTLASLGPEGELVRDRFAAELQLRATLMPWHTSRDRLRDLGHALDQIGAAGERIASEVIRLQSTEVAEVAEPANDGHVGSSTMPQKRNPMVSEYLIASARLLRGTVSSVQGAGAHAGERDMGLWAVEWLALPQAFILCASVVSKLADILEGLEVDASAMGRNIQLTQGALMSEAVMMALGRHLGHERAHSLVMAAAKRAAGDGRPLADVLLEDPGASAYLDRDALRAVMDPANYLGWSSAVVDAVSAQAPNGRKTS
jgi:3-carboxy-cis,cis-muconate cycloisomerase